MEGTHPILSPALLLPPLVSPLGKNCAQISGACVSADCPCLPLCSSNSLLQPSGAPRLPLCCSRTSFPNTRTSKWKPPYFPALLSSSSSLSLLTLLHCSSSQLSFPAACLSTASPSSSSSLSAHPSLTFVCEPPCLRFPSHTCRHTSAPPALSSTFSFLACTQIFSAVAPSCISPRHYPLLILGEGGSVA